MMALITILLVLLILVEAIGFWNNTLVVNNNYRMHDRETKVLRDQIQGLEGDNTILKSYVRDLQNEKISDAFVISREGITPIAGDWRKYLLNEDSK